MDVEGRVIRGSEVGVDGVCGGLVRAATTGTEDGLGVATVGQRWRQGANEVD
jgi:hypothetical protein